MIEAIWRTGNAEFARSSPARWKKMANGGVYDQLAGGFHRYFP